MGHRHGQFVWREVITPDVEASQAFYEPLTGWASEIMQMPDGSSYAMIKAGAAPMGGFMAAGPEMGPPRWCAYVSVADVDAAAVRAREAGGEVLVAPMDAGGIGRMAVIRDPDGATITAWNATAGDGERVPPGAVGTLCWEQLNTPNPEGAVAFYGAVFGWGTTSFAGMPVFTAGEAQVASVVQAPPGVSAHWLSHVVVGELEAARAHVRSSGGSVLVDEIAVPGMGLFAVITDPHGAAICLFEPRPG